MPNRFASGKYAIAMCDRCGQQYKLKTLKKLTIKTKQVNILVCHECWEPDQPQLSLGMYPVDDPQALRNPRPDNTYKVSGTNGLQELLFNSTSPQGAGFPDGGSREIQWGWAPVGGSRQNDNGLTPNNLILNVEVGTVAITIN
jgi:hypothetical protein